MRDVRQAPSPLVIKTASLLNAAAITSSSSASLIPASRDGHLLHDTPARLLVELRADRLIIRRRR